MRHLILNSCKCPNKKLMVFVLIELGRVKHKKIIRSVVQLMTNAPFFDFLQRSVLKCIYAYAVHMSNAARLKAPVRGKLVILVINRNQTIRHAGKPLLNRIIHGPVQKRCPLAEVKAVCGI
ncbi:hypothetical protein D3C78_1394290 [compost metagenome]